MKNRVAHLFVLFMAVALISLACGLPDLGITELISSKVGSQESAKSDLLGDEYQSLEGGFAFRIIPQTSVEEFYGLVTMLYPEAEPETGPGITFVGGINEGGKRLEELVDDFKAALDPQIEIRNQRKVKIGGVNGILFDVEGINQGKEVAGQVIVAAVNDQQMFSLLALFPPDKWDKEQKRLVEAIIQSVRFFEPVAGNIDQESLDPSDDVKPVQGNTGELIRLWASSAKASSEYDNPDWSAMQATGAPDTLSCGDQETAWASAEKFSVDWLEVSYAQPLVAIEVNIYESHTPTQIVKVELLDTSGSYHQVYTGQPVATDCPYILSIKMDDASYKTIAVKITVDQSHLDLPWDEIDAVELVGYASGLSQENQTDSQTTPPQQPTQAPKPEQPMASGIDFSNWSFENYRSADGLADEIIKALAASPDGTIWLGSGAMGISKNEQSGVSRFKNGQFTNYSPTDGLPVNNGQAVTVDSAGMVWAGTPNGLAAFDGSAWKTYTKKDGLVGDNVKSLTAASDGSLWIGTSYGVSHLDGSTWRSYTPADGLSDTQITDIALDGKGGVWFTTFKGVTHFDGSGWKIYTEADGLAFNIVNTVLVASDGSLWFGTAAKGVSHFDGSNWTTYNEDNGCANYVKDIVETSDGTLWFATEGKGIVRYDGQNWQAYTKNDGLPGNYVDALALSPDGTLWLGFRGQGLGKLSP